MTNWLYFQSNVINSMVHNLIVRLVIKFVQLAHCKIILLMLTQSGRQRHFANSLFLLRNTNVTKKITINH